MMGAFCPKFFLCAHDPLAGVVCRVHVLHGLVIVSLGWWSFLLSPCREAGAVVDCCSGLELEPIFTLMTQVKMMVCCLRAGKLSGLAFCEMYAKLQANAQASSLKAMMALSGIGDGLVVAACPRPFLGSCGFVS